MAIVTDNPPRMRPHLQYEFGPRTPITEDGPAPGLTGVGGIVLNQATMWAQLGHIVISDKLRVTETVPLASTQFYYGSWFFQLPKWLNQTGSTWRRYLTFIVDTDIGASPVLTMRAITSLGTTTGVRTSVEGRFVTVFEVPLPASAPLPNDATWFGVQLSVEWNGTGSAEFTVDGVYGYVKRVEGTLDNDANNAGVIDLVDATQIAVDQPLDVHSMRALVATNEVLFASNMRPVVTKGWVPGGTDEPGNVDFIPSDSHLVLSDAAVVDPPPNPYWEWLYWPRQGATRLRIGLSAIVTGDTRKLYLGFQDAELKEFTVSATSLSQDGTVGWQATGNQYLDIPPGAGPFKLRLGLVPDASSTDPVWVMKLFIHEEILKGNTLT